MLSLEQIEGLNAKPVQQEEEPSSKNAEKLQLGSIIHQQVDESIRKKTFQILESMMYTMRLYKDGISTAKETVTGLRKLIKVGREDKLMFSMSFSNGVEEEQELSIMNYLVGELRYLRMIHATLDDNGKFQLSSLWSEVSDLISIGNRVSRKSSALFTSSVLDRRDHYLFHLKQIVCDGIEKCTEDMMNDIKVERDNQFYFIECPGESVITSARFLKSIQFKDLDGALKIGDSGVIRVQNGQYCDIKGQLKMTFRVENHEKIEMILSSENPLNFGGINVHMDDESCGIFLRYCEDLKKEPRLVTVVEAAENFMRKTTPSTSPLSSIKNIYVSNYLELGNNASNHGVLPH